MIAKEIIRFRIILVCALVSSSVFVIHGAGAADPDLLFAQGDFYNAYKLYKKNKNPDAQTLYNKGVCAYKLGEYPGALVYLRAAQRAWGYKNFLTVQSSLGQVYTKYHEKTGNTGAPRAFYWLWGIYFSGFLIFILFLLAHLGLFLFHNAYKNKQKRANKILYFISSGVFFCLIITGYYAKNKQFVTPKNSLKIYSGPSKKYLEMGDLNLLDEALVQGSRENYLLLEGKHARGWAPREELFFL